MRTILEYTTAYHPTVLPWLIFGTLPGFPLMCSWTVGTVRSRRFTMLVKEGANPNTHLPPPVLPPPVLVGPTVYPRDHQPQALDGWLPGCGGARRTFTPRGRTLAWCCRRQKNHGARICYVGCLAPLLFRIEPSFNDSSVVYGSEPYRKPQRYPLCFFIFLDTRPSTRGAINYGN